MMEAPDSSGLIFSKDRVDLPENPEAIVSVIRAILAKPFIQNITIDAGGDIQVSWYREPSDSLTGTSSVETAEVVLDRIELVDSDYEGEPKSRVLDALTEVSFSEYIPTHIFCGNLNKFKKWLGIPSMVRFPGSGIRGSKLFMGFLLEETPSLPADAAVICGCRVKSVDLSDILFGVRVLMEDNNE